MSATSPTIAYLTAGAAGMYCGSCMRDNTLAAALHQQGVDLHLLPTYTPIRTDEEDVSDSHILYGGLNVYLQQKFSLFRYMPSWLDGVFDRPWLLNWLTRRGMQTSAKQLGELTVSMLLGRDGFQKKEVAKLVRYLANDVKPDLINFSNMLIAGCAPALKDQLGVPLLVTLQGDDIFLEDLAPPYKQQAIDLLQQLVQHIDGFLVFSQFYAEFMGEYLAIPPEKIRLVPMGIDTRDLAELTPIATGSPTIGYLARLAPEKGLHQLVDAFLLLRQMPGMDAARLQIAGWLGEANRGYAEEQFARLRDAGLDDAFEYVGSVDRAAKLQFLAGLDVLSVPTTYHDPKGLFILEALAAGVPVVQPEHGGFPELLAQTGGGRLVRPGDAQHLAESLHAVLSDADGRTTLGRDGRSNVLARFNANAAAGATLEVYREFIGNQSSKPEA